MCGVGGPELVLIIIVALVVSGPKDLPRMLRTLGQWAGRLRRIAADLRAQSGIDDALRSEGLADDIAEIRKLARGELDGVARAARFDDSGPAVGPSPATTGGGRVEAASAYRDGFTVSREREYPRDGADSYGSLPDNAIVYVEGLPRSALARDPLYVLGDEADALPPEDATPSGGDAPPLDAPSPDSSGAPASTERPTSEGP